MLADVSLDNGRAVSVAAIEEINHGLVSGPGIRSNFVGDVFFDKGSEDSLGFAKDVLIPSEDGHLFGGRVLGDVELDIFASINFGDFHHIKSEGSGLFLAEVVGSIHDFTR
jgi:hypothetical protein